MNRSLTIGTYAGIPVRIHWTFSLLIVFIAYTSVTEGLSFQRSILFSAYILVMFLCVVLHEFGHALAARRYGVKTKDIILSPIGGIARLEKLPEKPLQELIIALAGPAVNIVIALLVGAGLLIFTSRGLIPAYDDITQIRGMADFLRNVVILNLVLFVFNLLPAFPMDGGRVLRSLLALKLGRIRATKIASLIGRIMALGFIAFAVMEDQIGLALIGVFIFTSAGAESRYTQTYSVLEEYLAKDIMKTDFPRIHLSDSFSVCYELQRRNIASNFLVFDSLGYISGTIPELFLQEAKKRGLNDEPVTSLMSSVILYADENTNAKDIFQMMQDKGSAIVAIGEPGDITGVIDRDTLQRLIKIG